MRGKVSSQFGGRGDSRIAPTGCAIFVALALAGCATIIPTPTPTPTLTPEPTITPTPQPLLPPDRIWAVNDGLVTTIDVITLGGEVSPIKLPLNGDQRASDVIATPDGSFLAYLVWSDETTQRGIAAWKLTEPNARLVYQPLSGYRITGLALGGASTQLAFVEAQADKLPVEADWRVQTMPAGGGSATLVADLSTDADLLPPTLLGFAPDGAVYVNANTRFDVASTDPLQAIYRVAPDATVTLASPAEDRIIGNGAVSPDGRQIAYTTVPGALPGQPDQPTLSVGRIVNLETKAVSTLTPPIGLSVVSLKWVSNSTLLLDMLSVDGASQAFALAAGEDYSTWKISGPDETRTRLFTYLPLGEGVIYSVFPASSDGQWVIYQLGAISAESQPKAIPLGQIEADAGPPKIIYVPGG
jgi:WD40 repeat protein